MKNLTPFLKFHIPLSGIFVLTFILGISMEWFPILRSFHPFAGMSMLIILPLAYILSPKKKAINAMIKSNFKLGKTLVLTIARISSVLFMLQLCIMLVTGMAMYFRLYPNFDVYQILSSIHKSAIVLFPTLLIIHAGSRIFIKKKKGH